MRFIKLNDLEGKGCETEGLVEYLGGDGMGKIDPRKGVFRGSCFEDADLVPRVSTS